MNLLDSVKGVMTNAVVDKAASVLGVENSMMKSAMKLAIPAIIGGLINKGSDEKGAGGLIDLFKKGGFGDDNLGDLAGVLGDADKRGGMLETGADLLGTIFGNNKSGILDMILKSTGIGKSGGSSILSFLAPIVVNKLAGIVFGKNLSASGLSSYLNDQKSEIMGLVPGLSAMFGGPADVKESVSAAVGSAAAKDNDNKSSGGLGFIKYLLPILLLGAIGYWWMNKDKTTEEVQSAAATDKTEVQKKSDTKITTTTSSPSITVNTGKNNAPTYSLSQNGDILNDKGAIVIASGSYEFDAKGNLVDKGNKRVILPASDMSRDLGEEIMALLAGMTKAVSADDMKSLFGDMIMKKSTRSSYALSNIEFNKEDHKISNFSKAEIVGLAEALKANVNGKIEVQVYTNDGKNEKESSELSDTRANVVRDMLVTLGVDKKQISAKGMGIEDAIKAENGKVEVVIK